MATGAGYVDNTGVLLETIVKKLDTIESKLEELKQENNNE